MYILVWSYVTRHWILRESTMRFIHCFICIYDVEVTSGHLNPVYEINRIMRRKRVCAFVSAARTAEQCCGTGFEELTDCMS